jgi:GTPase SAR1 family protein
MYVKGIYEDVYNPTIEDSYTKKIELNNEISTVYVLDTAGQEEFSSCRAQYMREGEGFILGNKPD